MDPNIAAMSSLGSVVSGLTPLLTVGGVAAVVTFGFAGVATTANVVAGTRRRSLWRQIGAELGLRQETEAGGAMALAAATPVLRGIRHGRAVEATLLPNGQAQIAVRVANPRHLLDQIPVADLTALAGAGWLTATQCQAVNALKDRRRRGSIAVRGSFVTLTASFGRGQLSEGEPLRALFQLVQAIAESVDAASGAVPSGQVGAPPGRGPHRFGPGTLTAHRR